MKDYNKQVWEDSRPDSDPIDAITYCLNCLYNDNSKTRDDEVVSRLTFEELIGGLLLAKDVCEAVNEDVGCE